MLILLSICILTVIFLYVKHVYSYWERKGFPYIVPSIPFGNLASVITRKTSFGVNIFELYKSASAPFVGIYLLFRPAILVRDAELIKKVLSTDFNYFYDRGIYNSPKHDPLSDSLFSMKGQRWKKTRAKLTPMFTSNNLKNMMPTLMTQADKVQDLLKENDDNDGIVEIKEVYSRFTLNVVASVGFGLEVDLINDPNHYYRQIGHEINNPGLRSVLTGSAVFLFPRLLEFLRIRASPKTVEHFMTDMVKTTIEHREKNNISRKDLIQGLIEIRSVEKSNNSGEITQEMSMEQCAAQVLLFYLAGFETTSATIAYTIFELAKNQSILKKSQEEIDEILKKHDNKISYESIKEMKYLELCLMETIRKYPALPLLNRECTMDYKVPNSDFTIEKGTSIVISLLGIARDPQYFPEPEKYIPERFLEENQNHNPAAYIPFGDGPRQCIASRLGILIAKVALIKSLQMYNFESIDDNEIEFDNFAVPLVAKGGVNVKISKRSIS